MKFVNFEPDTYGAFLCWGWGGGRVGEGRGDVRSPLHMRTMARIHARTVAMVRACTMAILHACTMAIKRLLLVFWTEVAF